MQPLFPPEYPDHPEAPLKSFGPNFSEQIARTVMEAVRVNEESPDEAAIAVSASLTMLEAFHPRDHLETMLAAQGVAAHAAIMECHRRAMHPETSEAAAHKYRAGVVQMHRVFTGVLRDLERRQAKPLAARPEPSPPRAKPEPGMPGFEQDQATRPDGTIGSLSAYAPERPDTTPVPRDAPINMALATRPKQFRMVNIPGSAEPAPWPPGQAGPPVEAPVAARPVADPPRMYTGDALARFTSAPLDPDAVVATPWLDNDVSIVELELVDTGGDPEFEAHRAALMAAHPEGRAVTTFRYDPGEGLTVNGVKQDAGGSG